MAKVPAGGRLRLRTSGGTVPLRALQETDLEGRWSVPVLAPLRALTGGDGVLEVGTATGLFSVSAHLRLREGVLELRAGSGSAPALLQRRGDVRGRLALPLRAVAADAAAERTLGDQIVEGVTLDVSAGGLGVDVHPRSRPVSSGSRLYLELNLPDGAVAPTVVSVVQLSDRRLHGRFLEIAPVDKEHLVRLVFERQRQELAARAARRDADLSHS